MSINELERQTQLPVGFNWVRLGDHVSRIGSGFTPRGGQEAYVPTGIPLIRSQNVHMNRFKPNGLAFISPAQDAEMAGSRVQENDVLLNITGASIGRVCVVDREYCPANVNQHVCVIRTAKSIDPEFLAFFLSSPTFQAFIWGSQAGATRQALTKGMVEDFLVPRGPLAEQRRIAARLKEELAEVARARTAVEAQLKAAQLLPAALLRNVFQGTDAKLWPIKQFWEVVDNFDGRREPLNLSDRQKRQGEYPYYGASGIIDHIDDYQFDGEFLLVGEDGANLLARSTPIAFTATGKFWVNNHAHVVRPKQGVLIDWLRHYFASIDLSPFVSGSAQPKLSQENLNTIPTPVPTEAVQSELVRKLNSELLQHETLSNSIQSRLDTIEKLPAALLRNAFLTVQ